MINIFITNYNRLHCEESIMLDSLNQQYLLPYSIDEVSYVFQHLSIDTYSSPTLAAFVDAMSAIQIKI